jgi:hypothetical protein
MPTDRSRLWARPCSSSTSRRLTERRAADTLRTRLGGVRTALDAEASALRFAGAGGQGSRSGSRSSTVRGRRLHARSLPLRGAGVAAAHGPSPRLRLDGHPRRRGERGGQKRVLSWRGRDQRRSPRRDVQEFLTLVCRSEYAVLVRPAYGSGSSTSGTSAARVRRRHSHEERLPAPPPPCAGVPAPAPARRGSPCPSRCRAAAWTAPFARGSPWR